MLRGGVGVGVEYFFLFFYLNPESLICETKSVGYEINPSILPRCSRVEADCNYRPTVTIGRGKLCVVPCTELTAGSVTTCGT